MKKDLGDDGNTPDADVGKPDVVREQEYNTVVVVVVVVLVVAFDVVIGDSSVADLVAAVAVVVLH